MKQQHFVYAFYMILILGLTAVGTAGDYPVLSTSDVVTIYFGVELDGSEPRPPITMPSVHTDIRVSLLFSGLDIYLNSDSIGPVEPNEGMFDVDEQFQYQLGSVPSSLAFLGVQAGQTFWYYRYDPYPGFNSTDTGDEIDYLWPWNPKDPIHQANSDDTWLKVQLMDVRGPEDGYVSMFDEGSTGNPIVFFSTYDGGITEDDVYYIPTNVHSHKSWAFTQPGLYEVDLQVSTYYACDGTLTGDLNDDCFVDIEDYAVLSRYWLRQDCNDPNNCGQLRLTDPNEITMEDLDEVTGQWLLCGSVFESECP